MAKANRKANAVYKQRAKSQRSTGSTSANYHEGTRSEYLAQYVFASLGTSVPVPSREDTGLDLHCILTERIGQRIWPLDYYSVQVKSTDDDWVFAGRKSVEWLVKYPLPIFLCVVTKTEARIRVYHTLPRFTVWATPLLPRRLVLRPGSGYEGTVLEWGGGDSFSLGAPILDFTVQDSLRKGSTEGYKEVLSSWIRIEKENLLRVTSNVRTFQFPDTYLTGVALQYYNDTVVETWECKKSLPRERKQHQETLKVPLIWLTYQLFESGDISGAVKGALLFRHLFGDDLPFPLIELFGRLTARVGEDSGRFAGIDAIDKSLDDFMPKLAGTYFQ